MESLLCQECLKAAKEALDEDIIVLNVTPDDQQQ